MLPKKLSKHLNYVSAKVFIGNKILFWNFLNTIVIPNFRTGLCVNGNLIFCIAPLNYWIWKNFIKCTELNKIGYQSYMISLKSISAYAAKHFELLNHYLRACFYDLIPTFLASNTLNQTYFHAQIPRSFFGFQCIDMCYLSYNANFNIIISDFHQKYVKVKSLRRSG